MRCVTTIKAGASVGPGLNFSACVWSTGERIGRGVVVSVELSENGGVGM